MELFLTHEQDRMLVLDVSIFEFARQAINCAIKKSAKQCDAQNFSIDREERRHYGPPPLTQSTTKAPHKRNAPYNLSTKQIDYPHRRHIRMETPISNSMRTGGKDDHPLGHRVDFCGSYGSASLENEKNDADGIAVGDEKRIDRDDTQANHTPKQKKREKKKTKRSNATSKSKTVQTNGKLKSKSDAKSITEPKIGNETNGINTETNGTFPTSVENIATTIALLSYLVLDDERDKGGNTNADIEAYAYEDESVNRDDNDNEIQSDGGEIPVYTILACTFLANLLIVGIKAMDLWTSIYAWTVAVGFVSMWLLISAVKQCLASNYGHTANKGCGMKIIGALVLLLSSSLISHAINADYEGYICYSISIAIVLLLWSAKGCVANNTHQFWRNYWVSLCTIVSCHLFYSGTMHFGVAFNLYWGGTGTYEITYLSTYATVVIVFILRHAKHSETNAYVDPNTTDGTSTNDYGSDSLDIITNINNVEVHRNLDSDTSTDTSATSNSGIYYMNLHSHLFGTALSFPIIVWIKSQALYLSTLTLGCLVPLAVLAYYTIKSFRKSTADAALGDNSRSSTSENQYMYPKDSYSFLAFYSPVYETNLFCFGLVVLIIQVVLLMLITFSIIDGGSEESENPSTLVNIWASFIPASEKTSVRIAQLSSIVAFVTFRDSNLDDFNNAIELFPDFGSIRKDRKALGLGVSCFLRLIQGILGIIAVTLLVMTTTTVSGIILNFTAMNFISNLDNIAFKVASLGKFGPSLETAALRVASEHLPACSCRTSKYKSYVFGLCFVAVLQLGVYWSIVVSQEEGQWFTQMLRVQFKDALRSPYSGCFKIDDYGRAGNWFHYNSYPSNNASATIGYCTKEQRWLIFDSLKYDSESDPCSATEIARSSMTSAFDVGSTFEESWFSDLNTPVEMFFFQATNEEEFHCDSFINDGICNPSFNDLYNQFDGGDCCAATCKGPHCGIHDGDVSARKYLHCKDQQSTEPITFLEYLDATELMSRENLFQHNTSTESLEVIELSKSNFFGTIPSEIGLMTNLRELDLSTNRLSGTVPTEIGLLTKVTSLRLDRNQLSGPIPSEIGLLTKLTHLGLFDNQFDSTFPTEITLLTNLSSLELCDNHFNSTVPSEIKYLTNLKSLHLCIHQLHGTIPGEILSLKLTSLILNGNHFRSTIPTEIGLLSNLGELSINGFRGNIPSEIIHLKELTSLVLNDNQFESSIPKEIGLLTKLTQLGLSHNQLTGTIPNEIRWLTNMEVMDLKMNKLTGTILSEIGFLTNLIYLDLSYNQLDGSVPIESGKLKRLESFLINDNRLVGTLPAEVYWMDLYELNWRNNPELDVPPYYLWE